MSHQIQTVSITNRSTETAPGFIEETLRNARARVDEMAAEAGRIIVGDANIAIRDSGTVRIGTEDVDLAERDLVERRYTWDTVPV